MHCDVFWRPWRFAGGSVDAGDDALCATLCYGGGKGWVLFSGGVLEVPEVMRRMLLYAGGRRG